MHPFDLPLNWCILNFGLSAHWSPASYNIPHQVRSSVVNQPVCAGAVAIARCASIGADFDSVRWLLPLEYCAVLAVAVVPVDDVAPAVAAAAAYFAAVEKQSKHSDPKWRGQRANPLRLVFADHRVAVLVYRLASMADRYPFSLAEVTAWLPC